MAQFTCVMCRCNQSVTCFICGFQVLIGTSRTNLSSNESFRRYTVGGANDDLRLFPFSPVAACDVSFIKLKAESLILRLVFTFVRAGGVRASADAYAGHSRILRVVKRL